MDPVSQSDLASDDDQFTSTVVCSGKDSSLRSDPNNAKLERERLRLEGRQAADRIRAFYNSGVPFFTKEAIADLSSHIDRARTYYQHKGVPEGNKDGDSHVQFLSLKALDGETAEVENDLGAVWPQGCATEEVFVDIGIDYKTYQHLIAECQAPHSFDAKLAYCPLRVEYEGRSRDIDTKEFWPQHENVKPLETTQAAFHAGVKAWEDSEECRRLRSSLMAHKIPDKITKIIAFACCTISGPGLDEERSIIQHALILTIKDVLQKSNPTAEGGIQCYAQDPIYTEVDKAVLGEAGIHVLDDPLGFLEVDDSSVVISFGANVPVRQIVADIARPAIMIWDKVIPWEVIVQKWQGKAQDESFERLAEIEAASLCEPESSRLREMIQNEYYEIQNPSLDVFGIVSSVYVRRW